MTFAILGTSAAVSAAGDRRQVKDVAVRQPDGQHGREGRSSRARCRFTITVTAVDDAVIKGTVDAIDALTDKSGTVAVGDEVTMETAHLAGQSVAVGDQLLASLSGDTVKPVIVIDDDDRVTCQYDKSYRPTVQDAKAKMLSESCSSDVHDEMGPIECDDAPSIVGCTAAAPGQLGGAFSPWSAASALAVGIAGAWRRRSRAKR